MRKVLLNLKKFRLNNELFHPLADNAAKIFVLKVAKIAHNFDKLKNLLKL